MAVAALVISCAALGVSGFAVFLTWWLAKRRERFDRNNAERARRQDSYERLSANVEIIHNKWDPKERETRSIGDAALLSIRQEVSLDHGCFAGDFEAINLLNEIEQHWSAAEQLADGEIILGDDEEQPAYLVDVALIELRELARDRTAGGPKAVTNDR